jgi:hypothetical protein
LIVLTAQTDPKRREKPGWSLRRASAASTRANARKGAAAATENRQKPPKTAFDFGRSEAGSDALIGGPQPPSASKRFLRIGRKSLADTLSKRPKKLRFGLDAAPGGRGLQARHNRGMKRRPAGRAKIEKKCSKKRFDSGRSEAFSDYLTAGRRLPSAPSDSIEFGRNPYSKHCPERLQSNPSDVRQRPTLTHQ